MWKNVTSVDQMKGSLTARVIGILRKTVRGIIKETLGSMVRFEQRYDLW